MTKQKIIIFDIDETLIDISDKPHLDHLTVPRQGMVTLINRLMSDPDIRIHIVTGRHVRFAIETVQELGHAGVTQSYILHMNTTNDPIVKGHESKRMIVGMLKEEYDIVCAFDDDEESCAVYQSLGIQVCKVLPLLSHGNP